MRFISKKIVYEQRPNKPTYFVIVDEQTRTPDIAANVFLIYLRDEEGAPPTTVKNYASTLTHFLNAVLCSTSIQSDWKKLQRHHLIAYHIERAKELEPGSLETTISRLKRFFDWCYKSGWIEEKVQYNWKLPSDEARQIKVAQAQKKSTDPFNLFGQYIPEYEFKYSLGFNPRKRGYERIRDEIVLQLGYYTGMRAAETVDPHNISLKNIQDSIRDAEKKGVEGLELPIIGKGRNGGKTRVIYIPPFLRRQIQSFMQNELSRQTPDAKLLIGKKDGNKNLALDASHASNLFIELRNNLLTNGDLENIANWSAAETSRSFHSLRHSYATNFGDDIIADVSTEDLLRERMGHSHISTTRIYLWFAAKKAGNDILAKKYAAALNSNARKEFMMDQDDGI